MLTGVQDASAELTNALKDTSLYDKESGNFFLRFTGIKSANQETTKKFSSAKDKLKAINSYINNRNTQSLKILLKKAPEGLLERITPHDVTEKETIKMLYNTFLSANEVVTSEEVFFNTIIHHTIANSCGDDPHRIKNNEAKDGFFAGKKHTLLILNHLKKIKDEKPDLVKQILSATDIQGKTPFLLAIMTRNYQIAEMLLDLGADPNIKIESSGIDQIDGLTPLHIAYVLGHSGLIQKLKENGANQDAQDAQKRKPDDYIKDELEKQRLNFVCQIFDSVNLFHGAHYTKDERGKLPEYKSVKERLFEAIKNGDKKEVELMLPICNINAQDICGRTIVMIAVVRPSVSSIKHKDQRIRLEILDLILSHGNIDLNIKHK